MTLPADTLDSSAAVTHSSLRPSPTSRAAQRRLYLAALPAADGVLLLAAFGLAYLLRFRLQLPVFQLEVEPWTELYLVLSLGFVPAGLILFWAHRLYDWEQLLGGYEEFAAVFRACLIGTVLIALGQFSLANLLVARGWVLLSGALAFALVSLGRFGLRQAVFALRRHGWLMEPALILGVGGEGRLVGEQLRAWPTAGLQVLGFLDDRLPPGETVGAGLRVLGSLQQLPDYVETHGVGELILTTSALPRETVLDIFRRYGHADGVRLRLSSGLFDLVNTGLHVSELASVPLISVNRVRLSRVDGLLKSLMDYSLTLAGLLVLWPLLLLLALLIRRDSPGPILHRRRVIGLNGRQFDAFKFRTMHLNGDQLLAGRPDLQRELTESHKLRDDPRVTRLGRCLRRYSLDELPQLLNVLRGEMSLVGPRMISPPELEKYGQWATNLLTVRPGLTGLWQVSGRSDVSYAERVRLDMFYIRNYSLWLDIDLILRTIPIVLGGRGAY